MGNGKKTGIWHLVFVGFICLGCTSVSGNMEPVVSFSEPTLVNGIAIGSYTYTINDTGMARPGPNVDNSGRSLTRIILANANTSEYVVVTIMNNRYAFSGGNFYLERPSGYNIALAALCNYMDNNGYIYVNFGFNPNGDMIVLFKKK